MAPERPVRTPRIGVLALQGDFAAHAAILAGEGAGPVEVRRPSQLGGLDGLVLPGGESTTMLRLVREYGFDEAIPAFAARGGAVFGTCAGAILLATRVVSPDQWSFALIDIDIERNAYGRQIDSFEAEIEEVATEVLDRAEDPASSLVAAAPARGAAYVPGTLAPAPAAPPVTEPLDDPDADTRPHRPKRSGPAADRSLKAAFIRAPRILRTGRGVSVLARFDGDPVLVRQGRILASTFHPEIAGEPRVHRYFLDTVAAAR